MNRDLNEIALRDISTDIAMGPFGSNLKADNFVNEGVPVIRGANLPGFYVDLSDVVYVSEEKADTLGRANAYPGDIVVTHRGTLGQVSMIPRTEQRMRYVVSQSQMRISINESIAVPEYVTYWFRSRIGQRVLLAFATQTGVPAIAQPTSSLRSIKVPLPSLDKQYAIISVLGVLEGKIAANRRVADGSIALGEALVYSRQGDSARIDEIATVAMGTSPKSDNLNENGEGVPFFQGVRDFGAVHPRRRVYATQPVRMATEGSVLLAVRAPVGEVNLAAEDLAIGRGLAAISSSNRPATLYFSMRAFKSIWDEHQGGGTVFASVNSAEVRAAKLPMPPDDTTDSLETRLASLRDRAKQAEQESINLTATRDELLPLLMNGTVTVKDAEKTVEDVV